MTGIHYGHGIMDLRMLSRSLSVILAPILLTKPVIHPLSEEASAAQLYEQALAHIERLDSPNTRRLGACAAMGCWAAMIDLNDEVKTFVTELEPALVLARKAAAQQEVNWTSKGQNGEHLIHLGRLARTISGMFVISARQALAEGNHSLAIDDLSAAVRVTRQAAATPSFMAKLIETAALRPAFDTLAEHLPAFSKPQLESLRQQLERLPKSPSLEEVFLGEYEVGKRNAAAPDPQTGAVDPTTVKMFSELKGFYQALATATSLRKKSFAKKVQEQVEKHPDNPFAQALANLFPPQHEMATAELIRWAMLETAIRIRLEGEQAASQSKDPVFEQPFFFKKTDQGFELGSKFQSNGKSIQVRFGP